jgi:hypothetical protein
MGRGLLKGEFFAGLADAELEAVTFRVTFVGAEFAATEEGEKEDVTVVGNPLTACVIAAAVFVPPDGAMAKV